MSVSISWGDCQKSWSGTTLSGEWGQNSLGDPFALTRNTAGQWGFRARLRKRREGGSGADFVQKALSAPERVKGGRWGRLPAGRSGKSERRNAGTVRAEKTLFGGPGGSRPSTAAGSLGPGRWGGTAGCRQQCPGGTGVQVASRWSWNQTAPWGQLNSALPRPPTWRLRNRSRWFGVPPLSKRCSLQAKPRRRTPSALLSTHWFWEESAIRERARAARRRRQAGPGGGGGAVLGEGLEPGGTEAATAAAGAQGTAS